MRHLEFESGDFRYSLTGDCITVFDGMGRALWRRFFDTHEDAKIAFIGLY